MTKLASRMMSGIVIALSVACSEKPKETPPPAPGPNVVEEHANSIEAWRVKHETDYRRDWVTIAGLFDLKPGPNRAGSAATNDVVLPKSVPASIGQFVLKGEQVRYEPA